MADIDTVWSRIERHAGDTFEQKGGGEFSYQIEGTRVVPDRTNRKIGKAEFAKALELVPLDGPGEINHLQGPSYIYGILMDSRIRENDW